MKKVFLIIGRTGSGKSSILKSASEQLNMSILKSYATRPTRSNETPETSDHTFITPEEAETLKKDAIAYFKRDDGELFATKEQLMNSDFYVVNPDAADALRLQKIEDIELIDVYIRVPKAIQKQRVKQRGDDMNVYEQRCKDEDAQFTLYEKQQRFKYHILNNTTVEDAVQKLVNIVQREMNLNE